MTLTWESTYAIALELRRRHPDVDMEQLSIQQIYDWTVALEEFDDEPSLCNDDILLAIYQDWFEEILHGQ
jgi:FeS assembly protein IscX